MVRSQPRVGPKSAVVMTPSPSRSMATDPGGGLAEEFGEAHRAVGIDVVEGQCHAFARLHHRAPAVAAVVFHVEGTGLVEEHVFLGIEQTVLVHVEHREDIAAACGGLFERSRRRPDPPSQLSMKWAPGWPCCASAWAAASRAARVRGG
jgi:hypothetical protein